MLIEHTQQHIERVGEVESITTEVLRVELPDPEPTITIEVKPVLNLHVESDRDVHPVYGTTGNGPDDIPLRYAAWEPNPRPPLWEFTRDFLKREFYYLEPQTVDKMADHFMTQWRSWRGATAKGSGR